MKIGIVSDGKFGDRAFEIIREKFPTEWIMAPFPQSMIADDLELALPECDLYISYVRHPDVALAIIEKQKPVILGVSFGPGFLRQAKGINENIVAPVTMCSLEDNTWVPEINEFAKVFGRPSFEVKVQDDGTIDSVRVIRGSPVWFDRCGNCGTARDAPEPGTAPALRPPDLPLLPGAPFRQDLRQGTVRASPHPGPHASDQRRVTRSRCTGEIVHRRDGENYRSENNRRITLCRIIYNYSPTG